MTAIRPAGDAEPPAQEPPGVSEPSSWVGEVARMIRDVVDSTPRTIRMCILIAVAAASWAYFK